MSQENVEIVRAYYQALGDLLAAYWRDPDRPSLRDHPVVQVLFDRFFDRDVVWDWFFTPETFYGREAVLGAAMDWLEAVDRWLIDVGEVRSRDEGKLVFADLGVRARGKRSGAPADQRMFSVLTVEDGRISRIKDYTERVEALEAAGLSG